MTVSVWARRLNFAARRRLPCAAHLPAVILITDRRRLPDPESAALRLPRGAAVLVRDYDHPDRAALAQRLARVCRGRGLRLLIAGDALLARSVRADGVHYSEFAVRRRRNIRPLRPGIVTAACHSAASLRHANAAGADACLLSPVFATDSHLGAPALGPWRFAALVRLSRRPVYALGGIGARNVRRLSNSGACGIAAIGAFAAPQSLRRTDSGSGSQML